MQGEMHHGSLSEESESRVTRSISYPVALNDFGDGAISNKDHSCLKSKSSSSWRDQTVFPSPDLTKTEKKKIQKKLQTFLRSITKKATVHDGAVTIGTDAVGDVLPDFLRQSLSSRSYGLVDTGKEDETEGSGDEKEDKKDKFIPPINICILIVGTRGDVQPFIAIGQRLKEYGHRVRLATHANFREFVTKGGLEFFPLGGDPKILAEYMVKNKGFLPSRPSDVKIQRKQLKAIINSTWPACTEADIESNGQPFVADAIIANPPAMGHTHVAEALKVPLHVFFTMPWTPTHKWPHPLARITQITGFENWLSYHVVDHMIWLGMSDLVNNFRRKKLNLRPVSYLGVPRLHHHEIEVPTGYIWSPSLAPKPDDWGKKIDVVGFCFLNLASSYEPPPDLVEFLKAGSPPIFVGFGSLPVQNPKKMTETIVKALEKTGQRGIIQRGWGGLGEMDTVPPHIYLLGNCPHDWLFPQCAAVIHHGGAGTTAAGLKAACPTTVIPFFGDQPFWGHCVHHQGVGPEPIPVEQFNLERLRKSIEFMMKPQVKQAAKEMAAMIGAEDGVEGAVKAFIRNLPEGIRSGAHSLPWMKSVSFDFTLGMCPCGGQHGVREEE